MIYRKPKNVRKNIDKVVNQIYGHIISKSAIINTYSIGLPNKF